MEGRFASTQQADSLWGAFWGVFVGDTHAMPVHWYKFCKIRQISDTLFQIRYYNLKMIEYNYGVVREYLQNCDRPSIAHPDSWKYYRNIRADAEPFDLFHDLAPFYQKEGNHYHQLLRRGENTLTLKIALLTLQTALNQQSPSTTSPPAVDYDLGAFLNFYFDLLLSPGRHQDTFVGEYNLPHE